MRLAMVITCALMCSPGLAYFCSAYCEAFFREHAICYSNGNIYPNHCAASCVSPNLVPQFVCPLTESTDLHLCSLRCATNSAAALNRVFMHGKCNCPRVYSPVCGTNGFTFFNDCFRVCNKINTNHLGPCDEVTRCPFNVPHTYEPVCAAGKTYANAAIAGCAGNHTFTQGAC